jgi:death on curing protein
MKEPVWLDRAALEAMHLDQVRKHGGEFGIRDEGLLESALARPRQRWSFEQDSDLGTLAAALGFGLIRNHPFVDGNKRVGFVGMNVFLILNGWELEAPEAEVVDIIVGTASGALDEAALAAWVASAMVRLASD